MKKFFVNFRFGGLAPKWGAESLHGTGGSVGPGEYYRTV